MTVKIKRTGAADYGRYMKVLICGVAGSGKTIISSTAPNPFYVSAEGGLMSIADRHIPYAEVRSSDDLLALKNSLDQSPDVRTQLFGFPVDTIVIDTIDEIQRILVNERLKETKKTNFELKDWGWLGEQMTALVSGFRNLEANVIFLCHLKETSDGDTGRVWIKPGLQGAIGDQIANYPDLSLLLKATTTTRITNGQAALETTRVLQTYPEPLYPWIKDRSGKLPMEVEVNFQDDFVRLHALIFGGIDTLSAQENVGEVTSEQNQADSFPPPTTDATASNGRSEKVGRSDLERSAAETETTVENEPPLEAPKADPTPEPAPAKPIPETGKSALTESPNREEEKVLARVATISPPPSVGTSGEDKDFRCAECGAEIDEDQADLSRIRFRRYLCKPDAKAENEKKKR